MYADDTTLLSTYDTFHTNTDTDLADNDNDNVYSQN